MAECKKTNTGYSKTGSYVKTRASVFEFEFMWKVEKFSRCPPILKSDPIIALPGYPSWQPVLSLKDDKLRLYFGCGYCPPATVRIHSFVQDCNNGIWHEESVETQFVRVPKPVQPKQKPIPGTLFLWPKANCDHPINYTIDAVSVVSPTKFKNLKQMPEDIAIFKCMIESCIHSMKNDTFQFQSRTVTMTSAFSALSNDLKTMLDVSLYADVEVLVGDSVLHAHKSILCSRSPVFSKMFENPMNERTKNAIEIVDIELPVVKNLLSFLYTGILSTDDFEAVHDLYYPADKYDVSSLRKECADILLSKLEVGNACRTLALASRYHNEDLKKSVMAYIQFHFDAILKTESWTDLLSHEPKLASEIMSRQSK